MTPAKGAAELSQFTRPPEAPVWVSVRDAIVEPSLSLISHTRPALGLTSGTPTGNAWLAETSGLISTRACALMKLTTLPNPKYQGRLVSVNLTSISPTEQGFPVRTVVSTGADWL